MLRLGSPGRAAVAVRMPIALRRVRRSCLEPSEGCADDAQFRSDRKGLIALGDVSRAQDVHNDKGCVAHPAGCVCDPRQSSMHSGDLLRKTKQLDQDRFQRM
jgi:hypothetical protein